MTNKDEKYNGWTNYETWNIALWCDNDEPTYRTILRMAERSTSVQAFAKAISEMFRVNNISDISRRDLHEVNYIEVARSILDENSIVKPDDEIQVIDVAATQEPKQISDWGAVETFSPDNDNFALLMSYDKTNWSGFDFSAWHIMNLTASDYDYDGLNDTNVYPRENGLATKWHDQESIHYWIVDNVPEHKFMHSARRIAYNIVTAENYQRWLPVTYTSGKGITFTVPTPATL